MTLSPTATLALEPIIRLLESRPLPTGDGDKNERGTVVLVAGSQGCPGAAILGSVAALRAGAGRVQIVTAHEVATAIGVAVPEALSLGWDGSAPTGHVHDVLSKADALCIGPGLADDAVAWAHAAAGSVSRTVPILLDAGSLAAAPGLIGDGYRCLIAPNAVEAAELVREPPIEQGVHALAVELSNNLRIPVAVRGATTVLVHGDAAWYSRGATGLGTPGSGDVFAGITAGLLARGLDDTSALGWGIAVHARAGRHLGSGHPTPGFLARELLAVIPEAINALSP